MILVRESRLLSHVTFTRGKAHKTRISFSNMYRKALFDTTCGRFDFEHTLFAKRVGNRTSRTECRKSDFIFVWTFKRPHKDKITFSLAYRKQFFDTTCGKLYLGHAFLFKRVRNRALRTEC